MGQDSQMRARVFPCLVALLLPLAASCETSEPPPAYTDTLPSAEEALTTDAVPDWALGYTFTRHHVDVDWFHYNDDGTVYAEYDGGDVGGSNCERIRVENGRLVAPSMVRISAYGDRTTPYLVRTVDGRFFVHVAKGYAEYQRADLCGRGGGGCGGYDSVAPCTANELASHAKVWGACYAKLSDAGSD
jgi:hypothetical protein